MDKHLYTYGVFFDLSRAFDCLNPEILCKKLEAAGIRDPVNSWIRSYISNRQFFVSVENTLSDIFYNNLGTPQGGVLGPLLFLLYVNDMPEYFSHQQDVFIYADDTTMVISAVTREEAIQKVREIIVSFNKWCDRNGLVLNLEKTIVVQFSYGSSRIEQRPIAIKLGDENILIKSLGNTRFLGTFIDCNLNFKDHAEDICKKLNKAYFMLHSLKNDISTKSLIEIYYAQVYSILSQNIIIWGRASECSRIFTMQKRILRLIFNMGYRDSCRNIFKHNGILTLSSIYAYKLLSFIFGKTNNLLKSSDIHGYNTRTAQNLHQPQYNHANYKKSPLYAGSFIYNKLPPCFKNHGSLKSFQTGLKRYLANNAFYSIDEFLEHVSSS